MSEEIWKTEYCALAKTDVILHLNSDGDARGFYKMVEDLVQTFPVGTMVVIFLYFSDLEVMQYLESYSKSIEGRQVRVVFCPSWMRKWRDETVWWCTTHPPLPF